MPRGWGGTSKQMRVSLPPLDAEETARLRELLELSGGRSLPFCRGLFAAVATAPSEIAPTTWLPLVMGPNLPDVAAARVLVGLSMREYGACVTCLESRVPAVPDPADRAAIEEYCRGYLQLAHQDERWTKDTAAFDLGAPLMLLSGYVKDDARARLVPEGEALSDFEARAAQDLADHVARLFEHFAAARAARAPSNGGSAAERAKVGRNEPCPCGSGKKYKKCCAV